MELSEADQKELQQSLRALEHQLLHADNTQSKSLLLAQKALLEREFSKHRAQKLDKRTRTLLHSVALPFPFDSEKDCKEKKISVPVEMHEGKPGSDDFTENDDGKLSYDEQHIKAARAAADVLHKSLSAQEASQMQIKAKGEYLCAGCEQQAQQAQARADLLEHTARALREISGALEQKRVGKLNESRWLYDHALKSYWVAIRLLRGSAEDGNLARARHTHNDSLPETATARNKAMHQVNVSMQSLFARESNFTQHTKSDCTTERDRWDSIASSRIAALNCATITQRYFNLHTNSKL